MKKPIIRHPDFSPISLPLSFQLLEQRHIALQNSSLFSPKKKDAIAWKVKMNQEGSADLGRLWQRTVQCAKTDLRSNFRSY